jgi:hypothetical protein
VSVYAPSQQEIAREERLLQDPRWQHEREAVHGLLSRLGEASSDDQFFQVHVSLVARLKARQEHIGELRDRGTALSARRRELAEIRPKPIEDLRQVQRELEDVRWQATVQRALHWLLLDVGDALVWRRLGCDRAAITVLGLGNRVAWLSDGAGWDAEVGAVNQLWDDGTLALINDATTCLRLGDLTCLFDDRVEIREVKSGKLVHADHPQQVRLRDAITLINERRATVDGSRRAIIRCPDPLETYLDQLPRILTRARRDGRTVASTSRSQLVVAHDLTHPPREPFDHSQARAAAGWPADDIVMNWGSSLRRMRDRHHSFAYFAPLALLPIDIADKVDLLLGQLDYTVWLNVSSVARLMRGRGLITQPIGPPESAKWFLRAGRMHGNTLGTGQIAAHVREMMAIELVTPAYIAKMADALLRSILDKPELVDDQALVVPGHESAAWLST